MTTRQSFKISGFCIQPLMNTSIHFAGKVKEVLDEKSG